MVSEQMWYILAELQEIATRRKSPLLTGKMLWRTRHAEWGTNWCRWCTAPR